MFQLRVRASRVVDRGVGWTKARDRRPCEHCGKTWVAETAKPEEIEDLGGPVIYHVGRCRRRGGKAPATTTPKPNGNDSRIRHHRCEGCEYCFKSLEG